MIQKEPEIVGTLHRDLWKDRSEIREGKPFECLGEGEDGRTAIEQYRVHLLAY